MSSSKYFKYLPNLYYNIPINGKSSTFIIKDIACNARVQRYIVDSAAEWDDYHVSEGDTWDRISEKLYGTPNYHWLLMLLNLEFSGNTSLPANGGVVVKAFNRSMLRQDDNLEDKWHEDEPHYRLGARRYQVAVDFTDGEEVYALPDSGNAPDQYTAVGIRSEAGVIPAPWAQATSLRYVRDADGVISLPQDLYDAAEFLRRRPWLQDPLYPLSLNDRSTVEFVKYIASFGLLTARDFVLENNDRNQVIKVFNPKAVLIAAEEIIQLMKDID